MNFLVVLGVLCLLLFLLTLLGFWQRKIEESQRAKVIADIRDAEERGTSQPISQHPQIDVQACIGCGTCVAVCPEDNVLGLVDGVARVIHGSRCIGHGRCEVACPVAAVKVGLGDVALRPDIPILSETLETSVPGVFIAGELGGFSLIRNAVNQGAQVVSQIADELQSDPSPRGQDNVADVLIVGAGPAGFAATLRAIECKLSYVAIDQEDIGGTIRKYPRRKLTLTGPLELPLYGRVKREEFLKEELIEFWESIVQDYDLEIRSGIRLLGIERTGDVLTAHTSRGLVLARRVMLCLGKRGAPRKIGVPGEDLEKVLYQLVDTATYTNEHILVIGGGDSAIEAATGLANQPGNVVTLSYRRANFFRLKRRNEERIQEYADSGKLRVLFRSNVTQIDDDTVSIVCEEDGVENTVRIKNDFVFVFAGGEPPFPLLRKVGVGFSGSVEAVAAEAEAAVSR